MSAMKRTGKSDGVITPTVLHGVRLPCGHSLHCHRVNTQLATFNSSPWHAPLVSTVFIAYCIQHFSACSVRRIHVFPLTSVWWRKWGEEDGVWELGSCMPLFGPAQVWWVWHDWCDRGEQCCETGVWWLRDVCVWVLHGTRLTPVVLCTPTASQHCQPHSFCPSHSFCFTGGFSLRFYQTLCLVFSGRSHWGCLVLFVTLSHNHGYSRELICWLGK